jgi:succinate dehydrogenase / fumarate reductase cytochrome b subunit
MLRTVTLYRTTIGKKAVMAVSGAVLFGFVITHFLGNLNLYAGPEEMNAYAAWLRTLPALLWGARGVLLLAVVAHIWSSFQLGWRNSEARPVRYHKKLDLATTYAAKSMYLSGPILLLFIIYHLMHLTFGVTPGYEFDSANVYDNVVLGFQRWYVSLLYVVANMFLGIHLFHGVWSMMQTVGLQHPRYDHLRRLAAALFAFAITAGNLSFPILVMAGVVRPSYEIGIEAPVEVLEEPPAEAEAPQ